MGTFTHEADLFMILEPLRRFLRERRESVHFQMVGISAEDGLGLAFRGLPVQILRAEAVAEYPAFVRWMLDHIQWDMGVAPLVDNPFTRCKSDIKFLDYSLMGIPGIYSEVESYRTTVKPGETGLLAGERSAAWYEELCRLADDSDLRAHIRQNAFRHVHRERVLEHCVSQWQRVIQEVAFGKADNNP
jgi:glycosyltransferase involved in cell wall biosynthesis